MEQLAIRAPDEAVALLLVPHDKGICPIHPQDTGVGCPAFLNAWNFFDDLARLQDEPYSDYVKLSRSAEQSYDKLFWGNNLPSMTPPGECFTPIWSAEELEDMRRVMEAGLKLVEAELTPVEGPPRTSPCT